MSQEADYAELWERPTEERARAYAAKYMPAKVGSFNPKAMLAGVHKARVEASEDLTIISESVAWLTENGFKLGIDERNLG